MIPKVKNSNTSQKEKVFLAVSIPNVAFDWQEHMIHQIVQWQLTAGRVQGASPASRHLICDLEVNDLNNFILSSPWLGCMFHYFSQAKSHFSHTIWEVFWGMVHWWTYQFSIMHYFSLIHRKLSHMNSAMHAYSNVNVFQRSIHIHVYPWKLWPEAKQLPAMSRPFIEVMHVNDVNTPGFIE